MVYRRGLYETISKMELFKVTDMHICGKGIREIPYCGTSAASPLYAHYVIFL